MYLISRVLKNKAHFKKGTKLHSSVFWDIISNWLEFPQKRNIKIIRRWYSREIMYHVSCFNISLLDFQKVYVMSKTIKYPLPPSDLNQHEECHTEGWLTCFLSGSSHHLSFQDFLIKLVFLPKIGWPTSVTLWYHQPEYDTWNYNRPYPHTPDALPHDGHFLLNYTYVVHFCLVNFIRIPGCHVPPWRLATQWFLYVL